MNYLSTAFRNAVAYFILDNTGLVRMIMDEGTDTVANSMFLGATYTVVNEGIDFMDNGKSNVTTGNYFRVLDGAVWNFLYVFGVTETQLVGVASSILDSFGVPGGAVRTSVLNGVFITLANIIREIVDTQAPKQLRIATQPTSFLYSTATGNTNSYL